MFFLIKLNCFFSQNLILNSSFSEVNIKKNNSIPYSIFKDPFSDVKNWYIPNYTNYTKDDYNFVTYFSSRDKDLNIKERNFFNSDQLFENNLGMIELHLISSMRKIVIQQGLPNSIKKGTYCFKFKYKKDEDVGNYGVVFAFSKDNLSKFYKKNYLIPDTILKLKFNDSSIVVDKNLPWQQKCFKIELNGNEKFLTIGDMSNDIPTTWARSIRCYIDDIELYFLNDTAKCQCEKINKDLRFSYTRNFPINENIQSDTMAIFSPTNATSPFILATETKEYLSEIISFLQRNPKLKIKLIVYDNFNSINHLNLNYIPFYKYLIFFGIRKDRIKLESGRCYDPTGKYCGIKAELMKIGFEFYE